VDAGVEAIMCAYNRTNDEACCGSNLLLQEILLDEWNFQGHIVSDCGALKNFHGRHGLTSTPAESAALALKRGVNVNCGQIYAQGLKDAIEQGLVSEDELDASLKRLFRTRFKLGMFDAPDKNPYRAIGTDVINDEAKQDLALKAAHKSVVLLKNDNALPLNPNSKFIYMTGPLASNTLSLVGNYNGINSDMRTIVEGVAAKVSPSTRMQFRQGALLTTENLNDMDWFSGQAKDAEATIVVLGLTLLLEGEEGESIASPAKGDILDMKLPESQLVLLRKINRQARQGGKKVITVICAGMPLDLREVTELSDAVLYAWYPGERGGDAVADIIFGNVSPSAKLPITFPKSIDQLPDYENYSMEGRTYKYMKENPLYPFGFGLSYANLEWNIPALENDVINSDEVLEITVNIENTSSIDAEEVVQVYVRFDNEKEQLPMASLVDFRRVTVNKGKRRDVTLYVPYDEFSYYNREGEKVQHRGKATVIVGNASPGERSEELRAKSYKLEVEVK
jgi:beta-glucosidase